MPSTNVLVGLVLPWLVGAFWTAVLCLVLWAKNGTMAIFVAIIVAALFVVSWFWIPATPTIEKRGSDQGS